MNIHHRDVKFLPPASEPPRRLTFQDRVQRMFQHTVLIVIGLLLAVTGAIAVVAYVQIETGDAEDCGRPARWR